MIPAYFLHDSQLSADGLWVCEEGELVLTGPYEDGIGDMTHAVSRRVHDRQVKSAREELQFPTVHREGLGLRAASEEIAVSGVGFHRKLRLTPVELLCNFLDVYTKIESKVSKRCKEGQE